MTSYLQSENLLLAALPATDFELLKPHLQTIDLPRGLTLVRSGDFPKRAFFPHSGVISSIITLGDGDVVEVRITGRDGALGAVAGAGEMASFTSAVVRIEGKSSVIDLPKFELALERSAALRASLARHEAVQRAIGDQSIACNATHTVEARLARRLMHLSRTFGSTQFEVTQEVLAEMLGIRRNAVSLVAHAMKAAGIIRYSRGLVEIVDLDALRAQSCECYDTVTAYQHASEKRST